MNKGQNVTDKSAENPNFGTPGKSHHVHENIKNDRDSQRTYSLPPDKLLPTKVMKTDMITEKHHYHNEKDLLMKVGSVTPIDKNYDLKQLENTQNFAKKKLALDFGTVYENSDKNLNMYSNNEGKSYSERHKTNLRSTLNSKNSNKNESVLYSLSNVNQVKEANDQKQSNSLASTAKLPENQNKGIKDINTKGEVRIRVKKDSKQKKPNMLVNSSSKNQSDLFHKEETSPNSNNIRLPETLKNLGLDPLKLKGVDRHIALVALNSQEINYDLGMSKFKIVLIF